MLFKTQINTKEQRMIFEDMMMDKLTNPERRTVVNFGAELYRDGFKKGVITGIGYYAAFRVCKFVVTSIVAANVLKEDKKKKESYTDIKKEAEETAERV